MYHNIIMEYILFKKSKWSKTAIRKHLKSIKMKPVKTLYNNNDIVLYKLSKLQRSGGMMRAPPPTPTNTINWSNFPQIPVGRRQHMIDHLISLNFDLTNENVQFVLDWD